MCPAHHITWQQLEFRDFLRANPEKAREYEELKRELAVKFENDLGSYILGKTDFIKETMDLIIRVTI